MHGIYVLFIPQKPGDRGEGEVKTKEPRASLTPSSSSRNRSFKRSDEKPSASAASYLRVKTALQHWTPNPGGRPSGQLRVSSDRTSSSRSDGTPRSLSTTCSPWTWLTSSF